MNSTEASSLSKRLSGCGETSIDFFRKSITHCGLPILDAGSTQGASQLIKMDDSKQSETKAISPK